MQHARYSAFKRSRWLKGAIWVVAAFLVYTLLGFFALPPLIKWQMLKRLPGITKRQAAISQVKFNPLDLSLTVRGLSLTEPDGKPFASWEELYINFQASSLFHWAWTFAEIRLVKPYGEVVLFKDGQLNFANMFVAPTNAAPSPPAAGAPEQHAIPRISIDLLLITNGFVAFEDRTLHTPFHTEYRPINLALTRFTTQPDSDTPYSFHAESDSGRSVSWAGDLTVQPLRSTGHLEVIGVNLRRYQPYLENFTRALVTNGIADLQVDYRFGAGTNGLDLFVTNGLVHVEQMQLQDPDTGETVAGFRGFDLQQAQLNWRERSVRLGSVKLREAALLARLKPGGHLNLLDLLSLPAPASGPATNHTSASASTNSTVPWSITVDDFAIENTAMHLEDLTRHTPFKTELKPIEVSLKDLTTKPNSDARYTFRLISESAENFAGAGTISINPIRSAGEVKLANVELKKYLPYVEDFFRGKLIAGQLGAQAPYYFALATNGLQAGVSNLSINLTGLEVKAPDADETVTRVASFALEKVDANLQEQHARVGLVKADGGTVLVRHKNDGSINLLGLLARTTNPPPANASSLSSSGVRAVGGWIANVDEVVLTDYTLKIEDHQLAKPTAFLLDQFALNVKDASTIRSNPVSVALSGRFNGTGSVGARGMVRLEPLSAELQLDVTNIDLPAAQPYVEQYVRLGIVSGALSMFGQARYQRADTAIPQLRFAGSVEVTNFLCTDQVIFKEFARWDQLVASGIDCDLLPNRLKIDEVKWVAPRANVIIGTNHQPNLSLILKEAEPTPSGGTAQSPPVQPAAQTSAAPFPIQVGSVLLERASFAFTDESIQPHANIGIQELTGTIKGLSSALNTTADLDFSGRVDEQSPFAITGRVNPFVSNLFVDLVITNANTQLTPLTPYFEKYVGHPLNKGRLSTSLRYQVENKQLKAENNINIDRLTLGPRNGSPDATKLPVKLALALLKDSNERIHLDLPVSGRIDDPQFSVGPIIIKVLLNTLAKAVASPFKLLGALVGGGNELSFVEFSPGGTNLLTGELEKLTKLTKALAQRPNLNLEIEGTIDRVADRESLAKDRLREQLKAKQLKEISAKGKATQSAENFQLAPEDSERLLRVAFAEQFGTNVAEVLRTNQLALAVTNQPSAKKTNKLKPPLYQRVLAWAGLGPLARRSPVEKHLTKADRLALDQATPAVMENLIAARIPITDDDFRALMTRRARWVEDWLLQNGQVAPERLLLVAPKPVDSDSQGACRVNLSLD